MIPADIFAQTSVYGVFMGIRTTKEQLLGLVKELGVARLRDLETAGFHHRYVIDACSEGVIEKVGRGLYALPGGSGTPRERLAEACKRVPQGVICLFSALWFHKLIAEEPDTVWMMIDKKAREPQVDSLPIKFVRASGDAFDQGIVTLGLANEVQIRVYSPMKTVADCFKYADKIGAEVGPEALAVAVASNKYDRQRLLRFADICRVKQAVAAAEKARGQLESAKSTQKAGENPVPGRVWNREVLEKEVWVEPIRQLARKYRVSDVAIHKHCKELGIKLPGRGYWAKKASTRKHLRSENGATYKEELMDQGQ